MSRANLRGVQSPVGEEQQVDETPVSSRFVMGARGHVGYKRVQVAAARGPAYDLTGAFSKPAPNSFADQTSEGCERSLTEAKRRLFCD